MYSYNIDLLVLCFSVSQDEMCCFLFSTPEPPVSCFVRPLQAKKPVEDLTMFEDQQAVGLTDREKGGEFLAGAKGKTVKQRNDL